MAAAGGLYTELTRVPELTILPGSSTKVSGELPVTIGTLPVSYTHLTLPTILRV